MCSSSSHCPDIFPLVGRTPTFSILYQLEEEVDSFHAWKTYADCSVPFQIWYIKRDFF